MTKRKIVSFLLSFLMILGCVFSSGNVLTIEAASAYDKICTPNTSSYIYIWKSKSTDSEKIGKFSKGDGATILSADSDWLKIQSGSITGYVKKENVFSGSKLETFAEQNKFTKQIKVTASSLRVRKQPTTSSAILTGVSKGQTYTVLNETEGWAQIKVGSITGYVSKEYTTWSYALGTAEKYSDSSNSSDSSDSSGSSGLYNGIAVAKVSSDDTLNIRKSSSTSSSIIGKMPAGSSATIISKGSSWTKIKAGNITGYIYNKYYVTGDDVEAYAKSLNLPKQATLKTNMNVRAEASVSSARVGGAKAGNTFTINSDNGTWVAITFNGKTAYLKKSYLTITYKFKDVIGVGSDSTSSNGSSSNNSGSSGSSSNSSGNTDSNNSNSSTQTGTVTASSLNVRSGAGTSYSTLTSVKRGTTLTITGSSGDWYQISIKINGSTRTAYVSKNYVAIGSSSSNNSTSSSTSGSGDEIVAYALQFLGNPYVYGGTSLTNGADCSGFVQSVFKHFGYSLPRTSAAQSKSGTTVSISDLKKGDLLFYGSNGKVSHVGIYIGDNKIINASNERVGIVIYKYNYRTPITAKRYWK